MGEVSNEGPSLLWSHASELDLDAQTVGSKAFVSGLNSLYGPELFGDRRNPQVPGWYRVKQDPSPDSKDEKLLVNMGYEVIDLYVTAAGVKRAAKQWPGEIDLY